MNKKILPIALMLMMSASAFGQNLSPDRQIIMMAGESFLSTYMLMTARKIVVKPSPFQAVAAAQLKQVESELASIRKKLTISDSEQIYRARRSLAKAKVELGRAVGDIAGFEGDSQHFRGYQFPNKGSAIAAEALAKIQVQAAYEDLDRLLADAESEKIDSENRPLLVEREKVLIQQQTSLNEQLISEAGKGKTVVKYRLVRFGLGWIIFADVAAKTYHILSLGDSNFGYIALDDAAEELGFLPKGSVPKL